MQAIGHDQVAAIEVVELEIRELLPRLPQVEADRLQKVLEHLEAVRREVVMGINETRRRDLWCAVKSIAEIVLEIAKFFW